MTRKKSDLLAAEYVLGTLGKSARDRVAARLPQDPDLQAAVAAWEARLAPLAVSDAEIAPPASVWAGIEAAIDGDAAAQTIRADEGDWKTISAGVAKKRLLADPDAGRESFLIRLDPGAILPGHFHRSIEECVMLEGEMHIGDLRVRAGDYHVVPAGSRHPDIVSDQGALFFIRGELRSA